MDDDAIYDAHEDKIADGEEGACEHLLEWNFEVIGEEHDG